MFGCGLASLSGAEACYKQSLALLRQFDTRQAQSNVLAYMGLLSFMQGEFVNGRSHCQEALQLAQTEKAHREQAFARTFLAHNLLGLGELPQAQAAYVQAASDWGKLGDSIRQIEAQAGVAQTLLALGDVAGAATAVSPVLTYISANKSDGANDPIQIFLTCYQLLHHIDDPEAAKWLFRGTHLAQ